jgi:hypothetical protein
MFMNDLYEKIKERILNLLKIFSYKEKHSKKKKHNK